MENSAEAPIEFLKQRYPGLTNSPEVARTVKRLLFASEIWKLSF